MKGEKEKEKTINICLFNFGSFTIDMMYYITLKKYIKYDLDCKMANKSNEKLFESTNQHYIFIFNFKENPRF